MRSGLVNGCRSLDVSIMMSVIKHKTTPAYETLRGSLDQGCEHSYLACYPIEGCPTCGLS